MPITPEQIPEAIKWGELQECIPTAAAAPAQHLSTKAAKVADKWLSKGYGSLPERPKAARRKLAEHDELLKLVEAAIRPLRRKIAVLEAAIAQPVAPEPDEYEKWASSKAAEKYAGEFVALSEPGVVVAHSRSNDELLKAISNHPHRDDLVIDVVPSV